MPVPNVAAPLAHLDDVDAGWDVADEPFTGGVDPRSAPDATGERLIARAPTPVPPSGVRRPPVSKVDTLPPSSGVAVKPRAFQPRQLPTPANLAPAPSREVLDLVDAMAEADFLVGQGLVDDARLVLLAQLLRAPRHPAIVDRLQRLRQVRRP